VHLLVCYDVNTQTAEGRRRLRRVAQVCQNFGQRVQYSVFECTVNEANRARMSARLLREIDFAEDSLRIYTLGRDRDAVVEAYGRDHYVDFTAPLVI
jgi:CRISPR-associated protein Cas2